MRLNRRAFGKSLKRTKHTTNNHPAAADAKAEIRRNVLVQIGAADAKVFDAFAGAGEMHSRVWKDAAAYTGCDMTFYRDERECFVADNLLVMRAIDLKPFNIFDLDAWGSPWEHALIVAERRGIAKGEKLGLVMTEGSGLKLAFGGMPRALEQLAGVRGKLGGGNRGQDDLIDMALMGLCRRMGADITKRWQAKGTTGAKVRYMGLVLQGTKA